MTFGKMVAWYVEIGLVLAIIEPLLWKLFGDKRWAYMERNLTDRRKPYRYGFAMGVIVGSVTAWPIHLVSWYIIDPIIERRKKKIES